MADRSASAGIAVSSPFFSPENCLILSTPLTPTAIMISRAAAPSTSTLASLSSRSLRAQGVAARTFATVQEAPPVRHYGGLKDQDRIFTNLYGHHGPDIKSAMKYGGDWHRTKDIVLKGDDWVRACLACFRGRVRSARWDWFY